MKRSSLIAVVVAGVLSASASANACLAYASGNQGNGTSHQAVRTLQHSSTTVSCTPREYWFGAQCTSDRSTTSVSQAGHSRSSHPKTGAAATCTPRDYWLPAHCQ
jgi:hypothetical protein